MNITRTVCSLRHGKIRSSFYRKFGFTSVNYESTEAAQPQVQEEKFSFEDLKVIERTERRKPKINPFMKNVFVSIFDRDLLAYMEILNKEESDEMDNRAAAIERVFSDPQKTKSDRIDVLKKTDMFAAPVCLTKGGLAMNHTESLRYLEAISSDIQLGQQISDHWVALEALRKGLTPEQYQQIIDDLITGDTTIALCIKEKICERLLQPDFRTKAELDGQEIWRISGEKVCHKTDGYFLVLCALEANRIKAFLVHPGSNGITHEDGFVVFRQTPATILDNISESELSHTLGASRLHAATLSRCALSHAMNACVKFVRSKCFNGKPLSDLSTIRSYIGEAAMDVYASESAEYFSAGLADGFEEPDTEMEMAMCRNFIANHSLTRMLKLLAVSAAEMEAECNRRLNELRHVSARGETLDGINMFIAMNGLHHAGKMMSAEIKQIRNPLLNPSFILKKLVADRHQEKDKPKLTLFLAENLHPTLRPPAEQLEYCVLRMRFACETLMSRYGMEVTSAHNELNRLAEAATYIFVMTSVLARASRSYCIGLRHSEVEMKLASSFVENTKEKVQKLILQINDGEYINLDHYKIQFGKKILELNPADPFFVEKPTSRVFW